MRGCDDGTAGAGSQDAARQGIGKIAYRIISRVEEKETERMVLAVLLEGFFFPNNYFYLSICMISVHG